jgi:hypothetical protein
MLIMDYERTAKIIKLSGMSFDVMLFELMEAFSVSCRCYFDRKVIVTGLLTLGKTFKNSEIQEMGISLLLKMFEWLLEDEDLGRMGLDYVEKRASMCGSDAFLKDDPFLIENPIREMPFSEYVEMMLRGLEIPTQFRGALERLISFF